LPERECCNVSFLAVISNICWSAIPAEKYLPERRSAQFRNGHTTTPLLIIANYHHWRVLWSISDIVRSTAHTLVWKLLPGLRSLKLVQKEP